MGVFAQAKGTIIRLLSRGQVEVPLILLSLLRNAPCFWSWDSALTVTTWSSSSLSSWLFKKASAIPPWTSLWNLCPAWSSVERPQPICAVGRHNHCRVCVSISLRAFSPPKCVSQLSHHCLRNRRVSLLLKTCGKLSRSFTCALWMAVSFPYRFFKTSTASVVSPLNSAGMRTYLPVRGFHFCRWRFQRNPKTPAILVFSP